jgi:hypothetical protein
MLNNLTSQRLGSTGTNASGEATVRLLNGRLLEFCFFRFFPVKTYWNCLTVLLSRKEKNYVNSWILRSGERTVLQSFLNNQISVLSKSSVLKTSTFSLELSTWLLYNV